MLLNFYVCLKKEAFPKVSDLNFKEFMSRRGLIKHCKWLKQSLVFQNWQDNTTSMSCPNEVAHQSAQGSWGAGSASGKALWHNRDIRAFSSSGLVSTSQKVIPSSVPGTQWAQYGVASLILIRKAFKLTSEMRIKHFLC